MKVDLKDLREVPVVMTIKASPAELDLADDSFTFHEPVEGEVQFKLVSDRVLANGTVETLADSQCVRCLSPVRVRVKAIVDAVYENDDELLKTENKAFGDVDKMVTWFDGESIHPEPELREALMLELPTLPVCRDDCKGLCPTCGVNRNEEACKCDQSPADTSSWKSALKKIQLE